MVFILIFTFGIKVQSTLYFCFFVVISCSKVILSSEFLGKFSHVGIDSFCHKYLISNQICRDSFKIKIPPLKGSMNCEQSCAIEHHRLLYFFGSPWKLKSHQFSNINNKAKLYFKSTKFFFQRISAYSAYLISNQIFIPYTIYSHMWNSFKRIHGRDVYYN